MADAPDVQGVQADVENAVGFEAGDAPGFADTKVLAFEVPAGVRVRAVDRTRGTLCSVHGVDRIDGRLEADGGE